MARHINLYSVKGGQGVTTTAILLAKKFSREGFTVLLVDREDGDIASILGLAGASCEPNSVSDMASLMIEDGETIDSFGHDVIISDLGRLIEGAENYIVTQPDYVSLKRAAAVEEKLLKKTTGTIIVRPADRVLTDRDVTAVLNLPLTSTINMSAAVARASDAGVILMARVGQEDVSFPTILEEA